jgi:hypothetical protein
MPFMDDTVTLMVVFGLLAFMFGGLLPLLSSAILLTVKENERLVANSISTSITLLLGLIPSTFTYGLLSTVIKPPVDEGQTSTYPMTVTLYTTVFSSSLLMIGLVTALKVKQDDNKKHDHSGRITDKLIMKTGDGKAEYLITKREPLLMYSRSDADATSNNSSFNSYNDYDQHNHHGTGGGGTHRQDENEIPELPQNMWEHNDHKHHDFELDSDGCNIET